jgi:hypothetical protein
MSDPARLSSPTRSSVWRKLLAYAVRVFTRAYPVSDLADLKSIVNDEVAFYAHVVISWGIRMGLWEKLGNISGTGDLCVLFRNTNDYGCKSGEKPVEISNNWHVWRIGEPFRHVGKLEGENEKAEIGIVVSPPDIVKRMQTGKYSFVYPGFE